MILTELAPLAAGVLIFAAMMVVLVIDVAKAWQLHREENRRSVDPSSNERMEH